MKTTRDYYQTRNLASNIFEIEKELKVDFINVPKCKAFASKLPNVKFDNLKVIILNKDQIERYTKSNKTIVGESENFELVIINTSLNLVNKKTFEYRKVA